jgi:uncharacterized protein
MEFDRFTVVLLCANPDAPKLDAAAENELQDSHMNHLATMHEAGELLAAGPTPGDPARRIRGVCILSVDPDRARERFNADPSVRAGVLTVQTHVWLVPRGAVSFSPTRFPHSQAEL